MKHCIQLLQKLLLQVNGGMVWVGGIALCPAKGKEDPNCPNGCEGNLSTFQVQEKLVTLHPVVRQSGKFLNG